MISDDEAKRILKQEKFLPIPLNKWSSRDNHSEHLEIYSELLRSDKSLIEGLRVQLLRHESNVIGCNEKYTLFKLEKGKQYRVFQIEVYPRYRASHRSGKSVIYGPHLFYNGRHKRCSASFDCGLEYRERWFERFCRHTNITTIKREGSFEPGLFEWYQ